MRTKALILGAAMLAAGVATSMAQSNVYSVNVVGYVNVTCPAGGFVMVSNPLLGTSNDLNSIMGSLPNNTTKVYEWIPGTASYNIYTKRSTGYSSYDGHPILPGEGFFINNTSGSPITNTFVGQVMQGTNSVTYSSGQQFNAISSPAPISGGVETGLGMPSVNNDKVYQWDPVSQTYNIFTRRSTGWGGGVEPIIGTNAFCGPAEGFFYLSTAGGTWNQVFTVH